MITHFKKIKPSITELSLEEQLLLHRKIRENRTRIIIRVAKVRKGKTVLTESQKKANKMSRLLDKMSEEELDKFLAKHGG